MYKYDPRGDLAAKVHEAKAALLRAEASLKAYDWLIAHDISPIMAGKICDNPDRVIESSEFTQEEKAEFSAIFQ